MYHNVAQVPLAKDKALFQSVNVRGTQNMLEAARGEGVAKVVYTSSSAVFGAPRNNPVTEDTPPAPGEAYGRAKHDGEALCRQYAERGLDVTIIRPRTIMGHGRLGIFQILFEWIREGRNVPVLGAATTSTSSCMPMTSPRRASWPRPGPDHPFTIAAPIAMAPCAKCWNTSALAPERARKSGDCPLSPPSGR